MKSQYFIYIFSILVTIIAFQNFTPVNDKNSQTNYKVIKIGIVPVFEQNIKVEDFEFCFRENREGHFYAGTKSFVGLVLKGNCESVTHYGDKKGEPQFIGESLTIPLKDYLYGKNQIELKSVNIDQVSPATGGDMIIYPLGLVGNYWNNLISKNKIVNTAIGSNLKFVTQVTQPIYYTADIKSQKQFVEYLENALTQNLVKREQYDYIVPVYFPFQCRKVTTQSGTIAAFPDVQPGCKMPFNIFARATVSSVKKAAYIDGQFSPMSNFTFNTIVHELGHLLFRLEDTYMESLSGVKYPEGLPIADLMKIDTMKTCLMAGGRKATSSSEVFYKDKVYSVQTYNLGSNQIAKLNLPAFHLDDPYSKILCPYDIEKIKYPDGFSGRNYFGTNIVDRNNLDKILENQVIELVDSDELLNLNFAIRKKFVHPQDNLGVVSYKISFKGYKIQSEDYEVLLNGKTISNKTEIVITTERNKIILQAVSIDLKFKKSTKALAKDRKLFVNFSKVPSADVSSSYDKESAFAIGIKFKN